MLRGYPGVNNANQPSADLVTKLSTSARCCQGTNAATSQHIPELDQSMDIKDLVLTQMMRAEGQVDKLVHEGEER